MMTTPFENGALIIIQQLNSGKAFCSQCFDYIINFNDLLIFCFIEIVAVKCLRQVRGKIC
jgi:hypothetical protein